MLSFLEMSRQGAALILTIVALRALLVHRLPKAAFVSLWAVALCRLLLPFAIESKASVYAAAARLSAQRPGVLLEAAAPPAAPDAPPYFLVYCTVALLCAAAFLLLHAQAARRYRASLPVERPFVKHWLARLPLRRQVQVRYSDQIDSPLTYGLLRPVILLPKSVDGEEEQTLSFILAHELTHIRRFDTLSKYLLALALCVHWFNPLVWVLYALANRDLELSCDEAVLRQFGQQARAPYALTLVGLQERRTRFAPLSSRFSGNAMRERITAIMRAKRATLLSGLGALALVAAVVFLFATCAPRQQQELAAPMPGDTAVNTAVLQDRQAAAPVVAQAVYTFQEEDTPALTGGSGGYGYTQAELDRLVSALKFDGYAELSIAEFNRRINAALTPAQDWSDDALFMLYDRVRSGLPAGDPNADFLLNTVQASVMEYQTRLSEVLEGRAQDPQWTAAAFHSRQEEVFGDPVVTKVHRADYRFSYRILDQDQLTVRERDQFLQAVMRGVQQGLEANAFAPMSEKQFLALLEKCGQAASNRHIAFTGGWVDYLETM